MNRWVQQLATSKVAAVAVILNIGLSLILLLNFSRQQTAETKVAVNNNATQTQDQGIGSWAIYWCVQYETKVAKEPFSIDLLVACGNAVNAEIPGTIIKLLLPDPADLP